MTNVVVRGTVVHGDQRGRELGYPTANIRLTGRTNVPAFGIYAGWTLGHLAAVSIGVRPTFGDELEPLLEAHILDFDGDLYGQEISVELVSRLRDEVKFDGLESLVAQIEADIAAIRELAAA